MAKVKAGLRSKRGSTRDVSAKIIVHRTAERGPVAFEACIRVGKSARPGMHAAECAHGRNPRAAVANAMRTYAKALSGRKGSFRGVKR